MNIESNIYLTMIINGRTPLKPGLLSERHPIILTQKEVGRIIAPWAGTQLSALLLSGSYSKNTAITGSTDLDLFISLKSNTVTSLRDIYNSLKIHLENNGVSVKQQNVSLGVELNGLKVDLVPGVRYSELSGYHTIYKSKSDSWQKTNISQHRKLISESGRTKEIRALKIWRELNFLDFPSFYLEMSVLRALSGYKLNNIADNFWRVLGYLAHEFVDNKIIDPANSNNTISDDLTDAEKNIISTKALNSLQQPHWNQIIW